MTDLSTILIPADTAQPFEDISNVDLGNRAPVHTALVNRENPDECDMEFIAPLVPMQGEVNHRATMIAEAVAEHEGGAFPPNLLGDIYMRCEKMLADRLIKRDQKFIADGKIIKAFKRWLGEYAEDSDLDIGHVFDVVACYAGRVIVEAEDKAKADMQDGIAKMFGLQPEQVGVFVL